MATEKISNQQLGFIIYIMRSTIMISFLPVLTLADALEDAWISTLLVMLASLFFVYLLTKLDLKFPQLTVVEYSQQLLGKWLGGFVVLLLLWLFLQFATIELRLYGELITTAFLPGTPMPFIIAVMTLISANAVYIGLETIARATEFLFFLFLLMVLGIIIFSGPDVEVMNLQPVLTRGWQPIFNGALTPTAMIAQVWIITIISADLEKPSKLMKTSLLAIAGAITTLLLIVIITIGVITASQTARSVFPLLTLMRSVELARFLQRSEILVVFIWGFGLFVTLSAYLYSFVKGFSQLVGTDNYRVFVWPAAVLFAVLSIDGFKDVFVINTFLAPENFALYGFVVLLLPLFLLWCGYYIKQLRR